MADCLCFSSDGVLRSSPFFIFLIYFIINQIQVLNFIYIRFIHLSSLICYFPSSSSSSVEWRIVGISVWIIENGILICTNGLVWIWIGRLNLASETIWDFLLWSSSYCCEIYFMQSFNGRLSEFEMIAWRAHPSDGMSTLLFSWLVRAWVLYPALLRFCPFAHLSQLHLQWKCNSLRDIKYFDLHNNNSL